MFFIAVDVDQVVPVENLYSQFRFNKAQVLVERTEHTDYVFHSLDFNGSVYHRVISSLNSKRKQDSDRS